MKVRVVLPGELGAAELTAWRDMQWASRELRNPFLQPGFTLAVGRVRPEARVAVLEDGGQVVGFLPFERHALGVGMAIGAGLSDCQGLVHVPGLEWNPRELVRGCGLAVWEFDHLIASQRPFSPFHVVQAPSPVIDVSGGFQAYLTDGGRASKRVIRTTFAKARKLARNVGEVSFDFDVRDRAELRRLMRWKSSQYRRTGRTDRFARPSIVQLADDIFDSRDSEFAGTLSVLYADGRPVASHFGIRSSTILSCWFPAYDTRLFKYSPGLILHLRMAEAAAAAGLCQLDLGKGYGEYKESLKTGELTVAKGWVERRSAAAAVRRLRRTPGHIAMRLVQEHPALRHRADQTLRQIGQLRTGLSGREGTRRLGPE